MFDNPMPKDNSVEISILTGFSGCLALILGAVPVCLNMALEAIGTQAPTQFMVFTAVTALTLIAMALANDVLIKKAGKQLVRYGALLCGLTGPVLQLIPPMQMLAPAFIAIAISLFMLFWGSYLSTLNHRALTLLLLLATMFAGFTGMLVYHLNTVYIVLFSSAMFAISWFISFLMPKQAIDQIYYTEKEKSRERMIVGRGNRYTILVVGMMLGSSIFLVRQITLVPETIALVMGGCVVLAGLVMLLAYVYSQEKTGGFAKRFLTTFFAVFLLPCTLFGEVSKAVSAFMLFIFVIINIILIIDAISETARFNLISPFWIIGIEGGILFLGILGAQLIYTTAIYLFGDQATVIASTIMIIICCALQIIINSQSYPIFEANQPNYLDAQAVDQNSNSGQIGPDDRIHGAAWREKLEIVTAQYKLSPKQAEIMRYLLQGRDSRYIMERFTISKSTAKTHIYNLYKKLNIHSRQELLDVFEATPIPVDPVKHSSEVEQKW